MNSSISSSKQVAPANPSETLKSFAVALILIIASQLIFVHLSEIVQEGSKQTVWLKRDWAKQNTSVASVPKKDTVLFFGSSKVAAGIIPKLFDELNENTTYSFNFALPALPLSSHYFMLKDYLKHHETPRYILVAIDSDDFHESLLPSYAPIGASLQEIIQLAYRLQNGDLLLNFLFPSRLFWREIFAYLFGKIALILPDSIQHGIKKLVYQYFQNIQTFSHNWDYAYQSFFVSPEKNTEERRKFIENSKGYYDFPEQKVFGGKLPEHLNLPEHQMPASHYVEQFLNPFFELCEQHHIKVILITPYFLKTHETSLESTPIPLAWQELEHHYSNVYFLPTSHAKKWYDSKYFSDPAHANQEGAEKFTRETAEEFKTLRVKTV